MLSQQFDLMVRSLIICTPSLRFLPILLFHSTSAMSLLYECVNTVIAGQYWYSVQCSDLLQPECVFGVVVKATLCKSKCNNTRHNYTSQLISLSSPNSRKSSLFFTKLLPTSKSQSKIYCCLVSSLFPLSFPSSLEAAEPSFEACSPILLAAWLSEPTS